MVSSCSEFKMVIHLTCKFTVYAKFVFVIVLHFCKWLFCAENFCSISYIYLFSFFKTILFLKLFHYIVYYRHHQIWGWHCALMSMHKLLKKLICMIIEWCWNFCLMQVYLCCCYYKIILLQTCRFLLCDHFQLFSPDMEHIPTGSTVSQH